MTPLWLLVNAAAAVAQQTYNEMSTIDLFGNRNPIFNYMPNPGHVDPSLLDQREKYMDLREEEGWCIVSETLSVVSTQCLIGI